MEAEAFWQEVEPAQEFGEEFETFYPARFDDGRILRLPIRPLPGGAHALASLIINQAGFGVLDAIATDLAAKLSGYEPDIVVGLPTLGLTLAAAVAQKLGHTRYVPLGTSKKFWYREALSVPLASITTPDQTKRLYIDPRMVPLLEGARIVVVDDVISTGSSMRAGLGLLGGLGINPVAVGAAMLQSERFLTHIDQDQMPPIARVLYSPILAKTYREVWRPT